MSLLLCVCAFLDIYGYTHLEIEFLNDGACPSPTLLNTAKLLSNIVYQFTSSPVNAIVLSPSISLLNNTLLLT